MRGRSPERARPLAFALGYSRGFAAAKTDNRREAAAEGRERGSDNFFIQAKVVERGSDGQQAREHYSPLFPLPRKAENGVQTNLYFGESRRTGFRATAGEGAYLRRRSAVAQGGVCDRTRSRYQFPLCGFRPREHTTVAET